MNISDGKVRTDDLQKELKVLAESLGTLVGGLTTGSPAEDEVWLIYARVERLVAKLKLRLGVERPGVFQEVPTSKKTEDFLPLALKRMADGIRKLDEGDALEGLECLRNSRNCLRGYLADRRKVRMRERRRAAARRSSLNP